MVAFSFWEVLWSTLVIFFLVMYLMMLFHVIVDIFKRDDASGVTKGLWLVFLLFLPLLGLIVYLIANGDGMARRNTAEARKAQEQFDTYVRDVSGGGSAAEIAKAKELLDSGAISQAEFERLKAKALS